MKNLVLLMFAFAAAPALAQTDAFNGYCHLGASKAVVSGLSSSNIQQGIIPKCTVTVYLTGTTTKATIFTNAASGTLTNPFTADVSGQWLFYAANTVGYDVVMNGGTPPNAYGQGTNPVAVALTDLKVSSGGGGTGCAIGGIPSTSVLYTNGTNCLGNSRFTWDGNNFVDINSGARLVVEGVNNSGVNNNQTIVSGDSVQVQYDGADVGGGIGFFALLSDVHATVVNQLLGFDTQTTITRAGNSSVGFQSEPHASGAITTGLISGFVAGHVLTDSVAVVPKVVGFGTDIGVGKQASVSEFSFETNPLDIGINSNYCDFMAHNSSVRVSLGCGQSAASTFNGPATFQNITINGTCTGAGCGSGGAITLANVGAGASPSGLYDFSAATQLKLPSRAGYTAAVSGEMGYDTTNGNMHFNISSTDLLMLGFPSASGLPPNGNLGKFTIIGGWPEVTASAITDNGTTVAISKPTTINDGTGNAGAIGLQAGTAPGAAPANTIQINAPTAVTAYSVKLPGAQATGALTNDGAGNLSWTPGGGGGASGAISYTTITPAPLSNTNLVLAGDSRFAGNAVPAGNGFADYIMTQPQFASRATLFNGAVGGDTCSAMTSRYAANVQTHKPAGAITTAYLFIEEGINDIITNVATSTLETCYAAYVAQAVTDGFTPVIFTSYFSSAETDAQETQRIIFNNWLRTNFPNSLVIDADWLFPATTFTTNPFYIDQTHLNGLGNRLWAQATNYLWGLGKSGTNLFTALDHDYINPASGQYRVYGSIISGLSPNASLTNGSLMSSWSANTGAMYFGSNRASFIYNSGSGYQWILGTGGLAISGGTGGLTMSNGSVTACAAAVTCPIDNSGYINSYTGTNTGAMRLGSDNQWFVFRDGTNSSQWFFNGGTRFTLGDTAGSYSWQVLNSSNVQVATIDSLGRMRANTYAVAQGTAIASAATIAPTAGVTHITGTTSIATITPPANCVSGYACQITLIPDGVLTTLTSGNIALATTTVVSRALVYTYDATTAKWYPSY